MTETPIIEPRRKGRSGTQSMLIPSETMVADRLRAAPPGKVSDLGGLIAYRKNFDRAVLVKLMPGAILGILLGWATSSFVSDKTVELVVGVIGLVFALSALWKRRNDAPALRPDWLRGSLWGSISGYTSFVAHAGAAPYQVYAQPLRMTPLVYAGTTTIFFAVCNWVKLVPYAMLGQLSTDNLKVAAILTIPALISVQAGIWIVKRLSPMIFYKLITWMLLVVSIRLIWGGL